MKQPANRTLSQGRRLLLALLTLCLAAGLAPARARAQAPAPAQTADFEACATLSEDELRAELNAIAQGLVSANGTGLDVQAAVARQWAALELDAAVDQAVDDAVAQARAGGDAWDTFLSGWSPAKADALAAAVAQTAFGSERFRLAMDELAAAVAADVEAQVGALSAESAAANLLCLQEFVRANYSGAVLGAFAGQVRGDAPSALPTGDAALDRGVMAVLDMHRGALGGVGIIIASQLAKRVAQKMAATVSRRVAGGLVTRILGRAGATIIPLAGWIVGGGLIVYDVVNSLDGALPQIQEGLKAAEVKAAVQAQVAADLEVELHRELPQVARAVADDLYSEWLDFRRMHRQVLLLADESPAFAALLDTQPDLVRTAALVDAALAGPGRAALDAAVADGSFERMLALPPAASELLAAAGSFEAALAWADLAGADLDQVLATELYKHKAAADLTKPLLDRLLALQEPELVAKLALLSPTEMETLLGLSRAGLHSLAAGLEADQLRRLAAVLPTLDADARNQVVSLLAADPAAFATLERPGVWQAVARGAQPAAAVAFLDAPAGAASLFDDYAKLIGGAVPWSLYAGKYGMPTALLLVGAPLLLLFGLAYALLQLVLRPFADLAGLFRRRQPR